MMIYGLGHLSGAHFNPAVTVGFAVSGRFPKGQIGLYWFSQITGAFLAVFLLSILLPGSTGYGAVMSRVNPWQTFLWEATLTFFLMLVILVAATNPKATKLMIASAIGGMVLLGSIVGGPITGAAMNPARYLAPALTEGKWQGWWIYLAGAFIGAILAAILYEKTKATSPANNS